jgi:hypothetical protein
MQRCERGWQTTRDPAFVSEAQILACFHRQPLPLWLTEVVCAWAAKRRTKGHVTRAFNAAIRRMRYEAVQRAYGGGPKRGGLPWRKAYARAAEVLAKTRAAGSPDSMKTDYVKVKRDLREGRFGLYAIPKLPRKSGTPSGDTLKP